MKQRSPRRQNGKIRSKIRSKGAVQISATRRSPPSPSNKESAHTGAGISIPATEAKNRFGEMLKAVSSGSPVFIERHGRHQAVVLDIAVYESLLEKRRTPDEKRLEALRKEFDDLYARMQTSTARKATERLSKVSDEELNRIVGPRG